MITYLINLLIKIPYLIFRNFSFDDIIKGEKLFNNLTKLSEDLEFNKIKSESKIIDVHAAELFGLDIEKTQIFFGSIDEQTGKNNQAEQAFVAAISKFINAKNIFEFGTYMGRTTYNFAKISPHVKVTTIDLPKEYKSDTWPHLGNVFRGTKENEKITQVLTDSFKFNEIKYKNKMDFIWIDGDHSYEGVKNDTEKAFNMLKKNGIIMWHDYGPSNKNGLPKYIKNLSNKYPLFHIKKTSLLVYINGINAMKFKKYKMRRNPSDK